MQELKLHAKFSGLASGIVRIQRKIPLRADLRARKCRLPEGPQQWVIRAKPTQLATVAQTLSAMQ